MDSKLNMLAAAMLAMPQAPIGWDFGFPRIKRGNKYSPPKQEVPDFSTFSRQQKRRAERLRAKHSGAGRDE